MQAYENPAFVEDIARDAALLLKADDRIARVHGSRDQPREHPQPQRRGDDP